MNRSLLITLVLAIVVATVYAQAVGFDYINVDDGQYVHENPHIAGGITAKGAAWVFTSEHVGNWHPLTGLSHQLDCTLFGVNPGAHHGVNVFLHVANTLLLFGLLNAMTRAPWRSALVAALFGLHPLHVESVAWISERKDVLSTLFWFLATWAYVAYAHKGGLGRYALVFVLLGLGLMAKPMLVTLPFTLLLLDYWKLSERPTPVPWRRLILEKLPLLALSAASCIVTFFFQQSGGAVAQSQAIPLFDRIANAAVTYVVYIFEMFWPIRLAFPHPHPYMAGGTPWAWWQVAGATAILVGVTALAVALARRRYFPAGWYWYLGTLVPVIGLIQVGSDGRADRYTYVPLIGLFIIAAWGTTELAERLRINMTVRTSAAIIVLAFLAALTYEQAGKWKNSITLFEHTLSATGEDNFKAHGNLGSAYEEAGDLPKARDHFEKAVKANPDVAETHYNLGTAYAQLGKRDEAIEHLSEALRRDPNHLDALNNMGTVLDWAGRLDEAAGCLRRALEINPEDADVHCNLGSILGRLGREEEALRHFRQALRIDPNHERARQILGNITGKQVP